MQERRFQLGQKWNKLFLIGKKNTSYLREEYPSVVSYRHIFDFQVSQLKVRCFLYNTDKKDMSFCYVFSSATFLSVHFPSSDDYFSASSPYIFVSEATSSCTTIPDTQIFSTRYPVKCKVDTGFHSTSEIHVDHGLSTCTVDNIIHELQRVDYLSVQA